MGVFIYGGQGGIRWRSCLSIDFKKEASHSNIWGENFSDAGTSLCQGLKAETV